MRVTNLYLKVRRKQDLQPVDTLRFTTAGIDLNIRCVPVRQVLVTSLPILHQCGLQPGNRRENIVVDFANLHDLPSGTILRIGDALIRLTFHCEPCKPVLKQFLLKDILHKRGVLGQFLNSGHMRVGDRVIVTRACAEAIPYDIKTRIRWYLARQLEPVAASKLIFDLGLHSSYARALPAILRKMPDLGSDCCDIQGTREGESSYVGQ